MKWAYYGFIALMVVACTSGPTFIPSNRDAAPSRPIDTGKVADAVPKPVTRTKAGNKSPYTVLGKTYRVMASSDGFVQTGTASWYGRKFHGRLTSNGERFNMFAMTAAHKNLPIPTYVEVTNLENGKSVVVRVNDRGPFHGDRVIDLSWAAASKLGFADNGVARVKIVAFDAKNPGRTRGLQSKRSRKAAQKASTTQTASRTPKTPVPAAPVKPSDFNKSTYLQVSALSNKKAADKLAKEVEAYTKYPLQVRHHAERGLYRVLIGPLENRSEMNALNLVLDLAGLGPGILFEQNRP